MKIVDNENVKMSFDTLPSDVISLIALKNISAAKQLALVNKHCYHSVTKHEQLMERIFRGVLIDLLQDINQERGQLQRPRMYIARKDMYVNPHHWDYVKDLFELYFDLRERYPDIDISIFPQEKNHVDFYNETFGNPWTFKEIIQYWDKEFRKSSISYLRRGKRFLKRNSIVAFSLLMFGAGVFVGRMQQIDQ